MTADLLDVAALAAMWLTVWVVLRRPTRRWRRGDAGKALTIFLAMTVLFHLGPVPVPAGALLALVRHRRDPRSRSLVPLADGWPGSAR